MRYSRSTIVSFAALSPKTILTRWKRKTLSVRKCRKLRKRASSLWFCALTWVAVWNVPTHLNTRKLTKIMSSDLWVKRISTLFHPSLLKIRSSSTSRVFKTFIKWVKVSKISPTFLKTRSTDKSKWSSTRPKKMELKNLNKISSNKKPSSTSHVRKLLKLVSQSTLSESRKIALKPSSRWFISTHILRYPSTISLINCLCPIWRQKLLRKWSKSDSFMLIRFPFNLFRKSEKNSSTTLPILKLMVRLHWPLHWPSVWVLPKSSSTIFIKCYFLLIFRVLVTDGLSNVGFGQTENEATI